MRQIILLMHFQLSRRIGYWLTTVSDGDTGIAPGGRVETAKR